MREGFSPSRALLGLVLLSGVACGLVDSDIARFDLTLPRKPFNLDTADWMLNIEGQSFPEIACPPADCASQADNLCGEGACTAECVAATCELRVNVAISQTFNLSLEAPELDAVDDQPVIDVTVDSVFFEVKTNTLNVTTPPLSVYMAPQGVMDPANSEAALVGTIDAVAPGVTGQRPLTLTDGGKDAMKLFLDNYRTPFNIFVAGTVAVGAGDPVPEGALAGEVVVTAFVSP
jgi:hypothetical protein